MVNKTLKILIIVIKLFAKTITLIIITYYYWIEISITIIINNYIIAKLRNSNVFIYMSKCGTMIYKSFRKNI